MGERGISNSIKNLKYSRDSPASFNCSMLEKIIPKPGRQKEGNGRRERGYLLLAFWLLYCGTSKISLHKNTKGKRVRSSLAQSGFTLTWFFPTPVHLRSSQTCTVHDRKQDASQYILRFLLIGCYYAEQSNCHLGLLYVPQMKAAFCLRMDSFEETIHLPFWLHTYFCSYPR